MSEVFTVRADSFDALPWFSDPLLNHWIARILSAYGATLCDVGAGTGLMLEAYLGRFETVVAAELNAAMLQRLKIRARAMRGVHLCQASADHLPLRSASVDIVLSKSALHHHVSITTSLDHFCRVARRLVAIVEVVTPHDSCEEYLRELLPMKEPGRPASTVFSTSSLRSLMETRCARVWHLYHDQYIDLDEWIRSATVNAETKRALYNLIDRQPPDIRHAMQIHVRSGKLVQLRRIALVLGFKTEQ